MSPVFAKAPCCLELCGCCCRRLSQHGVGEVLIPLRHCLRDGPLQYNNRNACMHITTYFQETINAMVELQSEVWAPDLLAPHVFFSQCSIVCNAFRVFKPSRLPGEARRVEKQLLDIWEAGVVSGKVGG